MTGAGAMVLTLLWLWPFSSRDWREAEKVWRAGMAAEKNPQTGLRRHNWMPYAFLTRTGTDNVYRIVHKGRLLPLGGGVDALAAYLRDIDGFNRGKLKGGDVRDLLKTFNAYPPSEEIFGDFFDPDPLAPKLTRSRDKIELVVFYLVSEPVERHTRPPPGPTRDVEKWTLTIDRQHAAWTEEMIKVKRATMEPL
jgi:hypothetical protein